VREVVFVVPGEISTQSGGYSYDRRLMSELRLQGRNVSHLPIGASYPDPTAADELHAAAALAKLPPDCIVIIDGLALGALDTNVVASLRAELVALIHHPLAHEGGLDNASKERLLTTERENLKHAVRVIVPSPHTARLLATEYQVSTDLITVATPGTDSVEQVAKQLDPPLILSVGIQVPRKGHDVLLRALASIKSLAWQTVIVGTELDSDYAASLATLTHQLGLSDRVEFKGQLSDADLSAIYGSASIFALATRYEGYGMVFGEALAHGLPIVSCNVGAVPDTVPSMAGLLVEPDDPAVFGEALAKLLESPDLRREMTSAALQAAQSLISWEDSARLVGQMLDSLTWDRA